VLDFLQWIGAVGGVGAVFAVLMFLVYQRTIKQMREDRKFMEERMVKLSDDYNERQQETNKSRDDNTRVLAELYTYLRAKNGSK